MDSVIASICRPCVTLFAKYNFPQRPQGSHGVGLKTCVVKGRNFLVVMRPKDMMHHYDMSVLHRCLCFVRDSSSCSNPVSQPERAVRVRAVAPQLVLYLYFPCAYTLHKSIRSITFTAVSIHST
ncbi:hypothetical protein EXIGLDRAFT_297010 [Exidia glandulosa HHB12029]|uniref:Uncharacterized protein n=1 Tax=Exidia glandulosa HHB12029 TaxID=1314781 RepID=A0A165DC31_EXIGL|nr:hypothetical protein EXIGLDRAFT_297010 [Exidia glandulosa HHB12029]